MGVVYLAGLRERKRERVREREREKKIVTALKGESPRTHIGMKYYSQRERESERVCVSMRACV